MYIYGETLIGAAALLIVIFAMVVSYHRKKVIKAESDAMFARDIVIKQGELAGIMEEELKSAHDRNARLSQENEGLKIAVTGQINMAIFYKEKFNAAVEVARPWLETLGLSYALQGKATKPAWDAIRHKIPDTCPELQSIAVLSYGQHRPEIDPETPIYEAVRQPPIAPMAIHERFRKRKEASLT